MAACTYLSWSIQIRLQIEEPTRRERGSGMRQQSACKAVKLRRLVGVPVGALTLCCDPMPTGNISQTRKQA